MKAFICDNCGKQEQPDGAYSGYGVPPKGWFDLSRFGMPGAGGQLHFCSTECLKGHAIAIDAAKTNGLSAVSNG